jgi:hypothetical protein
MTEGFLVMLCVRAEGLERLVLSFRDLDREHTVFRVDLLISVTAFTMPLGGVIPARPE